MCLPSISFVLKPSNASDGFILKVDGFNHKLKVRHSVLYAGSM